MFAKPSWQTDELDEEWIDEGDEQEEDQDPTATGSRHDPLNISDISFTQPIGSLLLNDDGDDRSLRAHSSGAGTVLFHESHSEDETHFRPQTPAKAKSILGKDLFSPLPLETMFEPPSPPSQPPAPTPGPSRSSAPVIPSRLSQMYIPGENDTTTDLDLSGGEYSVTNDTSREDRGDTSGETKYEFTFEAPIPATPAHPTGSPRNVQQPQHTPMPNGGAFLRPPLTDPRLRLFQFQYDTFTREHLSAMVDSIAVNTPARGKSDSMHTTPTCSSGQVTEYSISRLRSAKRLKLSPASDFSESGDGAALILRPQSRKDYVGESKSLMEKIRQARDFSTISTQGAPRTPASGLENRSPDDFMRSAHDELSFEALQDSGLPSGGSSRWSGSTAQRPGHSPLDIREQAASLMNQIRSDVKSHKRHYSVDSNGSMVQTDARALQSHLPQLDDDAQDAPLFEGDTEIIFPNEREPEPVGPRTFPPGPPLASGSATNPAHDDKSLQRGLAQLTLDENRPFSRPPAPAAPSSQPPTLPAGLGAETTKMTFLAPLSGTTPPQYPAGSLHGGRKEDLNRFVSSSTASGGTVTSGSALSFVKHQGPKHITHISPNDLPPLPDRVGRMVFDRHIMKWVKAASVEADGAPQAGSMRVDGLSESEDPFRDIESIRDEDAAAAKANDDAERHDDERDVDMSLDTSRVETAGADSGPEDAEEAELTSFSFDASSRAARVPDGARDSASEEDDEDTITSGQFPSINDSADAPHAAARDVRQHEPALQDTPPHLLVPSAGALATPQTSALRPGSAPVMRSALKSTSVTPVSALKDTSRGRTQTPANKLHHRRSVSFSDGRREGPIAGVGRNAPTPDGSVDTDLGSLSDSCASGPSNALIPSARSKRIADMLEDLEDTSYDADSPSKGATGRPPADALRPLAARQPGASSASAAGGRERTLPQSQSARSSASRLTGRNATFLTECSFGVAHDRLVHVITDVEPFEPHWEGLAAIDLSHKGVESVARLKEFLPRLDALSLNSNQIGWLSGIPGTVRTLSVASNCLTAVTSFSHLLNLESLDISRNNIDSLRQLECLRHLRELRADGNMVNSLDGLQKMDGLVKLSLQGNALQGPADLGSHKWSRLEMLNLSHNRLSSIVGLSSTLPALIALNLDNNELGELVPEGPMPRLRILRVSGNRLQELNAAPFPNLRTLYADSNSLGPVHKAHRLTKLENLSLRNQSGRPGLQLSLRDVRDVKRLYLSGNPLKAGFISEPCYNLVYLELAGCRLTSLPADLARLAPNLRNLNLNYNFLEDVRPLEGLTRLRKLALVGSRVRAAKHLVRVLRGMLDVEMLDFRMNPCTLGWYLPLMVKDVPGALPPSDGDRPSSTDGARGVRAKDSRSRDAPAGWKEADAKFRRDLPDAAYVGRLAYRGLVMRACPALRTLDGVDTSDKERDKAERVLKGLADARRRSA